MVFEKEYIMGCSSAEWIARHGLCLEMMPKWCRQVNWGNWGNFPSELRSSLCERRLEMTVLWPELLPVRTAQFTQFFRQVWRHRIKSLKLTESVYGALECVKITSIKRFENFYWKLLKTRYLENADHQERIVTSGLKISHVSSHHGWLIAEVALVEIQYLFPGGFQRMIISHHDYHFHGQKIKCHIWQPGTSISVFSLHLCPETIPTSVHIQIRKTYLS